MRGSIGAFLDVTSVKQLQKENTRLSAEIENRQLYAGQSALFGWKGWPSIKCTLAVLVLATILPITVAMFSAVAALTEDAEARQRADLQYTAKFVASSISGALLRYIELAQSLSRQPSILNEELADFRLDADRLFPASVQGWVVVSDVEGQQLLTTRTDAGAALPKRLPQTMVYHERAIATRAPVISDVVTGAVFGERIVNVEMPIFKLGQPFRVLTLSVPATKYNALLHPADVPSNWLLGAMDSTGRYIARVPGSDELIGELASNGWRSTAGKSGILEFRSREGDPIVNANEVISQAGWTIGVAIKKSELLASANYTLRFGVMAFIGSMSLSLALAYYLSRYLARSILDLRDSSLAIVGGTSAKTSKDQFLPELQDAWHSLVEAVSVRDRQEEELANKTHQLESLIDSAPIGIAFFDRDHRFVRINAELAAINVLPVNIHIGHKIEQILPRNASLVGPFIDKIFQTGETIINFEVSGETPLQPGVLRHWLCGFFPIYERTEQVALVGVGRGDHGSEKIGRKNSVDYA